MTQSLGNMVASEAIDKGKNPKLKKFTVKVSGFFVDGTGNGIATVKNEGTWKIGIR